MTTICLIELTNRTSIIDDFGHRIDKLICAEFSKRINSWMRPQDKGSPITPERYCIALDGVLSPTHLGIIATNLEKMFDDPCSVQGDDLLLQVRLGFTIVDERQPAQGQEMLIRQAAIALSHARKENKLFSVYDQQLAPPERVNFKMIRGLRNALDQGQFRLHYQPKMHPTYKTAMGAEAVLRWYLSEGKVFPPEAFIRDAEANTIIVPISLWVIKSAIARAASWKNDLSISVNLSNRALVDPELETTLTNTVKLHQFNPNRLTFEVSDDCLSPMASHLRKPLMRLRKMGFRVSIDRFGAGNCSLFCFRNLPVDELKVHHSFVRKMGESKRDIMIAKSVITLAHSFGLRAVAVGAENEKIVNQLIQHKCDAIQGFYFDQPLAVEDFELRYSN